jgi:hypothetical protein
VTYAPEGAASAGLLLAPLVLAVASLWVSGRGHWAGPLLATPALLLGLALVAALFRNAAGPGIVGALVYAPLLLGVSIISFVRWRRRRASTEIT